MTVTRDTAERAIAHLLLFGSERVAAREVFRNVPPDAFADVRYRTVRAAAQAVSMFDLVTPDRLSNFLDEVGQLDHIGGPVFIRSLANDEEAAAAIEAFGLIELIDVVLGNGGADGE